ncbi:MAG: response regulator [Elusimicrobia bacterium]|nr:response regulator [Elusimicrobiota bacterium]
MQKTLEVVFSRLGCQVKVFGLAEAALERLENGERPDVMILDFRLPGISGPQLFRKMGMDETTRSVPVVPFTSHWGGKTVSDLARDWENVATLSITQAMDELTVVKKLPGNDFSVPEQHDYVGGECSEIVPAGLRKIRSCRA